MLKLKLQNFGHLMQRTDPFEKTLMLGKTEARRSINDLKYAKDTTLMAECEEELESLLMKEKKESEKAGLKLSIQKTKIMDVVPSLHGK